MMSSLPLTLSDVRSAHSLISPFVHCTPMMTSEALNGLSGLRLFFKCENLQKTGSFKARGATHALLRAKESRATLSCVVTHSSGNHGQAVAWAAGQVGRVQSVVVVPEDTPKVKSDAIRGYGADLVYCAPTPKAREEMAERMVRERDGLLIHPYDDYNVIKGQATVGLEIMEQMRESKIDLDAILVPISGGGLSAGIAVAAKGLRPDTKIIIVEPEGKNLEMCLRREERLWPNPPQMLTTLAEGIKLQQVGKLTFPILCQMAEKDVITVSDSEMIQAVTLVAQRMKLVIEPAAGSVVAAALKLAKDPRFKGLNNVAVVLCGGNLDFSKAKLISLD